MNNRLPEWFRQPLPTDSVRIFSELLHNKFRLNTVCRSARCPNLTVCFRNKHATFLLLGNYCTRGCLFCAIGHIANNGPAPSIDPHEPQRIAGACCGQQLEYVVITSVTRDDIADGGACQFVETIERLRRQKPAPCVELLIPDFKGNTVALEKIVRARPSVISHNIETVERLYPLLRDKADYRRSLSILKTIKSLNPQQTTKSSLMLGLGETEDDIRETLGDLCSAECDIVVMGQYLRPTINQYPVKKFYTPEEFASWKATALSMGFRSVSASPLARTSYQAKEHFQCTMSSYLAQAPQA